MMGWVQHCDYVAAEGNSLSLSGVCDDRGQHAAAVTGRVI